MAAELFSYSYDNYKDHLGVGNARFDKLMPEDAALLEQAEKEEWTDEEIAAESDFKLDDMPGWREKFREALAIVDAESPAQSFLRGIRSSVEYAVKEGLDDKKSIENLVGKFAIERPISAAF